MRLIHELTIPIRSPRRRGAAIVFTAMTMVVLIGFAALTIDVGYMYSVRIDLQNAADAAALTAASAYASEYGTALRSKGENNALQKVRHLAIQRAKSLADLNTSMGTDSTKLQNKDITLGYIVVNSASDALDTDADPRSFNAVHVIARRDGQGPNGAVELFFAQIFGYSETEVTASAVAAFEDRVAAVVNPPLIPFTIDEDVFEQQMAQGKDDYEYDDGSESVSKESDGVREVHLYPYKPASGNFGLLNIGPESMGATDLDGQTLNNIPADHLEMTFGSSDFEFVDDAGEPKSYPVGGNPGIKSELEGPIKTRIGDVVGIFIHDSVSGAGANTSFNITGIRFVRVMDVNLSTDPKYFRVQPVVYDAENVVIDPNAPSTGGLIGQVVLAR